jgi:hypothetical protein
LRRRKGGRVSSFSAASVAALVAVSSCLIVCLARLRCRAVPHSIRSDRSRKRNGGGSADLSENAMLQSNGTLLAL